MAFLFGDNHIVSEAFVEDVNNLLNSGEITGLFAQVRPAMEQLHLEVKANRGGWGRASDGFLEQEHHETILNHPPSLLVVMHGHPPSI